METVWKYIAIQRLFSPNIRVFAKMPHIFALKLKINKIPTYTLSIDLLRMTSPIFGTRVSLEMVVENGHGDG